MAADSTRWYVHVLALGPHYHHAPTVAVEMQYAIRVATCLRSVLALAPTATSAHIAVQHAAACGHTVPTIIVPGEEHALLAPLSVRHVPGVGATTAERLARFGITTIGAFAALPRATVVQILGPRGRTLHAAACGQDSTRQVYVDTPLASTWQYAPTACADATILVRHVQRLTERVGRHLRHAALTAGTITVGVQWADDRTQQRTERLPMPADLDQHLARGSHTALHALLATRRLAVRAVTARLGVVGPQQATVFDHDPRALAQQQALDTIKRRHGTDAIVQASLLPPPPA